MAASTPATVRKQIASGKTGSIYLIIGNDEDERTRLAREFADVVEEELRPFNVERLYGGETKPAKLLQAVHMLPMLGPRRIVIVSQAELVLKVKWFYAISKPLSSTFRTLRLKLQSSLNLAISTSGDGW